MRIFLSTSNVWIAAIIFLLFSCNPDQDDNPTNINNGSISNNNNPNTGQHSCGAPDVHNVDISYSTMADQEGNIYKTVVIGEQEWMAENLNTSLFRNGEEIPDDLSQSDWTSTSNLFQAACANYDNDPFVACPMGKLYNWYACFDSRGLCPVGWHVPSEAEWDTLSAYLGGDLAAGIKLKSTDPDSLYWITENYDAMGSNESGFSAIPGGKRDENGLFESNGLVGYWWSSSANGTAVAVYRALTFMDDDLKRMEDLKRNGLSVRCIRD